MKNFAKATLFAAVMLAALDSASGAEAQKGPCGDDAPGMEGCGDRGTAPSSSKEGDDANKMPRTVKVPRPIVYDTETDDPHHKDVELSPLPKDSLQTTHAKLNAKSGIPSSTFSSSPSTSPSSFSYSTSPLSPSSSTPLSTSPASTSEDVDKEVESDACAATPYVGTLDGRNCCPSPTLGPADTATTTTPTGGDKGDTHATASADCNGDTSTSTNTGTRFDGDSNNGGKRTDNDHDHTHNDGSNNRGPELEQTPSTMPPPTPTIDDMNPSVWSPQRVPTVGDKLIAEALVESTDASAVWVTEDDDVVLAKATANPPDLSSHKTSGFFHTSELVAADTGKVNRVVRARQELMEELEGDSPANENRRRSVWGWVPFRSQLQKDIETVREHFGEVEMTLTDRACVEVRMDGICVLAKSGPYKREWMNRFPWRWSKNNDYQLHVTDDGMEVRLGEKRVWGVAVDETME